MRWSIYFKKRWWNSFQNCKKYINIACFVLQLVDINQIYIFYLIWLNVFNDYLKDPELNIWKYRQVNKSME